MSQSQAGHVVAGLPYRWRSYSAAATTAPPTRLVLVRHGATELTMQGRYPATTDTDLCPQGILQAERVATRLSAVVPAVAAVIGSPSSRCRGTAEMIANACGAEVTIEAGLADCDFGAWEGLTFAQARAGWPVEHAAWLGSMAVAPPGGESLDAVATRVRECVEQTRSAYPACDVVLVSHVSPLRLLLRDALAAGNEVLHRLVLDPAGFSIVDIWPDGGVAVQRVNETCHLVGQVSVVPAHRAGRTAGRRAPRDG